MTLARTLALTALATFAVAVPPAALAAAAPPPIPAAALEKAEWFVVIDGQQVGPLTASAVERRMDGGGVTTETLIWREGMTGWTPLGQTATFVGRRVDAALKQPRPPARTDNKFVIMAHF